MRDGELWEVVALSCDIPPESARFSDQPPNRLGRLRIFGTDVRQDLRDRYDVACSRINELEITIMPMGDNDARVTLASFALLAEACGWSLPSEFPRPTVVTEPAPEPEAPPSRGPWPWGTHETKLLQDLAAAAEAFWIRYDPSDPTTAETNETVAAWLEKERGVSKRNAEVMATILRPTDIRTGPRR